MSISAEQREEVRRRAGRACEYCGVTETDTGGWLTIDHFQPQSQSGSDALDNLVYCCHSCNQFKLDYWPQTANAPRLWNPRQENANAHLLELADSALFAVTDLGAFTLARLRLNRPPLIASRQQRRQRLEAERLLPRLHDVTLLLEQMQRQYAVLLEENHALLQEQRRLLQILFSQQGRT